MIKIAMKNTKLVVSFFVIIVSFISLSTEVVYADLSDIYECECKGPNCPDGVGDDDYYRQLPPKKKYIPPSPEKLSYEAFNRAYDLAEQGYFQEAAEAYLEAIRHNPRNTAAHNNLGVIYGKWGDHQKASEHFLKACKISNKEKYRKNYASSLNDIASDYIDAGSLAQAEEAYRSGLGMYPRNAPALNGMGRIYQRRGNYDVALDYYRRAFKADPTDNTDRDNYDNLKSWLEAEKNRKAEESRKALEWKIFRENRKAEEKKKAEVLKNATEHLTATVSRFKTLRKAEDEAVKPEFMDSWKDEKTVTKKVHGQDTEFTQSNKPLGGGTTSAGAQLKSTKQSGDKARSVPQSTELDFIHDEKASGRGQLGFDTPGFKQDGLVKQDDDVGEDFKTRDPEVTDEQRKRMPQIVVYEKKRSIARKKRLENEAKLKKLESMPINERSQDWSVKLTEAKQNISTAGNEEIFYNFSIGDVLRKDKSAEKLNKNNGLVESQGKTGK